MDKHSPLPELTAMVDGHGELIVCNRDGELVGPSVINGALSTHAELVEALTDLLRWPDSAKSQSIARALLARLDGAK